jgi:peptide chain release factor
VARIVEIMREEAAEHGLAFGAEMQAGRPSIFVSIDGDAASPFARSWEGSVQWTARSSLRPGHKRKNWFVSVGRLPDPPKQPELHEADLVFEALRAGGPGGQHQNRTESAVRVTHRPTGASVVARDERSQHRNKALAIARLRALIAAVHERERDAAQFQQWLVRITVERGNPVRTYEGGKLVRSR